MRHAILPLSLLSPSLLWGLAVSLPAQAERVVPMHAEQSGNWSSRYFGSFGGGRVQQIVDGLSVCNRSAILTEVSLRADGTNPLGARSLSRVKLSLGLAANPVSRMSAYFAWNRKGAQTVVFDQAFTLPAQKTTRAFDITFKLRAPFFYRRADGDLLLEWEIPQAPVLADYPLDAHVMMGTRGYGKVEAFGRGGTFKSRDSYGMESSIYDLVPGGKAKLRTLDLKSGYPTVALWGFSKKRYGPLPLPFDLTPLGAPGNSLLVSIDFATPIALIRHPSGSYYGSASLPIPDSDAMVRTKIHGQLLFVDPSSNALGWVLSKGLSMTIANPLPETRSIGHQDSTSAVGRITISIASHVVRLAGAFR